MESEGSSLAASNERMKRYWVLHEDCYFLLFKCRKRSGGQPKLTNFNNVNNYERLQLHIEHLEKWKGLVS
jgi:hypothetical protein